MQRMRAGLRYCDNRVVMKFFSNYLFLWWHDFANSLRLLWLRISFFAGYKELFSQTEVTLFANIIAWFTFP